MKKYDREMRDLIIRGVAAGYPDLARSSRAVDRLAAQKWDDASRTRRRPRH